MSEQLAIHGGKRSVPESFVKPWPYVTTADQQAVMEVFKSDGIIEQQRIQSEGLAKEWAEYMGVKYCIPVNSGTAALHMCLTGVGIEPGDEVIVPAFTFWASLSSLSIRVGIATIGGMMWLRIRRATITRWSISIGMMP